MARRYRHRRLVPRATALGFDPADVAVGFGHVWVTGQITNTLYEIDPATGRVVRAIPVGREPMGVTVGDGAVWVANAIDGTISKVDPHTGDNGHHHRRRESDRCQRRRRIRLGGCGCELGDLGRWWRRSSPCSRLSGVPRHAAPPAAGMDPIRIGVITVCEGLFADFRDATLAGAELPFIQRGAHLIGRTRRRASRACRWAAAPWSSSKRANAGGIGRRRSRP